MKYIGGLKTCSAMGVALIVGGMAAEPAFAKLRASVETTVRLGYDINPFLATGSDLGSGVARGEVRPALSYTNENTQVVLEGNYEHSEYQRLYGHSDEYGATLNGSKRISPSLSVFATLRYDSSVIGQGDDLATTAPGAPPVDQTDVNLIGQRQRSNVYSAQGGFTYKLGPKDEISASGGATLTRFPGRLPGSSSDDYGGQFTYLHAISERTKIGFTESVYKIIYDIAGLNTLVVQPGVTFTTKLSQAWTLDATLGVSISQVQQPTVVGTQRTTGLAGSVNLCHKGSRNNFCFYGSRSVSSSGFGGSTQRNQGSFQFQQQITETLAATANATYAQTKSQVSALGKREYVSVQAGLEKKVTRRLKVGVDGRYRDVFGGPSVKADLGGEVNATLALPGPS